MKKLTKTEEQVMKYLWRLKKAFMKDLVDQFPEPKPAYTTIATIVSRMVEKDLVGFYQHGKVREYYPRIEKFSYFDGQLKDIVRNFFNDSPGQFASFFTRNNEMTLEELEQLKKMVQDKIEEKHDK